MINKPSKCNKMDWLISSKTGQNVEHLFETMMKKLFEKYLP